MLQALPENNTLAATHDLPLPPLHKDTPRHNAAPAPHNANHAAAPTSNLAANSSAWKQPLLRRRSDSEVSLPASGSFSPPIPRRLRTPDCMSSPVSHLRNLTRNLGDDHRRLHALRYLKEAREGDLQQRKLMLVLDLDETLVHSHRSTVRANGAAGPFRKVRSDLAVPADDPVVPAVDGIVSEDDDEPDSPNSSSDAAEGEPPPLLPIGALPDAGGEGGGAAPPQLADAAAAAAALRWQRSVTLRVQSVEFEMELRPGVQAFLTEMSQLFSMHLYTMGSREYVQQALHFLDPTHEVFKPGHVLAWNPAFNRTTKSLRRLLCHPQMVLIVDDSTVAWSEHLHNLLPIERFLGDDDEDDALPRMAERLRAIHRDYFAAEDATAADAASSRQESTVAAAPLAPLRVDGVGDDATHATAAASAVPQPFSSPLSSSARSLDGPSASAVPPLGLDSAAQLVQEPPERDVRCAVRTLSESVLSGVCCVLAGSVDVLAMPQRPPEVILAERFGARFESRMSSSTTHLLMPPSLMHADAIACCPRTSELLTQASALGLQSRLRIADLRWLLACVGRWEYLSEELWLAPSGLWPSGREASQADAAAREEL